MKQSIFTILSNTPLTDCVYKMVLSGDTLRDGLSNQTGSAVAHELADFLHRALGITKGCKNVVDAVGKVGQRVQKRAVQIE